MKKILTGIGISVVSLLLLATVALAVPSSVTDFFGTATSSKIYLRWQMATSSNSTVIRYSTTTYPTAVTGGTSAYNGTASYASLTGLTAGTNYYFSAWGYDGSDYSATYTTLVVTTLVDISDNTSLPYTKPTMPADIASDPDSSGWSIAPFDDILEYFADETNTHGGLGMPVDNLIMFIAGVITAGISVASYTKWHNFAGSWFLALILCCGFCSVGVMQWIVIVYLLLIGGGTVAISRVVGAEG